MDKKRDSFVFYRSFYESISTLDDESQINLYKAIIDFSLNQKEPILSGVALGFWTLIKPNLEANNKRWENGNKPKQKQEGSKTEAKQKQEGSKTEANKDKDKDKDKEYKESCALEFDSIWKEYTLKFLKSQGRDGGSKSVALEKYMVLRKKYSNEAILKYINSHKKLKVGHKDLQRALTVDSLKEWEESQSYIP